MLADHLIRMANQIGAFFEAMPDHAQAVEGIAQHIKNFWEPRMRRELLMHLDAHGLGSLKAIVAEALERHRTELV